jgi:hypothetical protein
MSGKGSARRPRQVSKEQFDTSWEETFGKEPKKVFKPATPPLLFEILHDWLRDMRVGR